MKTLLGKLWFIFFSLLALSGPLARAQSAGPGSALNLDGASGYAQAANGVWFNGNFTVEAWVFARSYNNWSRLIDFANGPDNNNVFLALSAGTSGFPIFGVYTSGGPSFQANTQLPTNQWVHLAATLNGTTGTIYINGNPVGSGTLNIPPNVVRTINYIGRSNYDGDGYANALFDDIRIWNVAKSQTQIQANMHRSLTGSETGLLGYWRMDEGTGAALTDSSGHGQTATLFGGTTWTNSAAPLVTGAGSALNFNAASSQVVSIPHQAALNAYPLTVMTWFKSPTTNLSGALVNKYSSGSFNGYHIFMAGGHLQGWYIRDSANNVLNGGPMDTGAVNDGLWHHAAMSIDAAGGRLYLDGVLKSSLPWTGTAGPVTTTLPVSLAIYQGSGFWNGQLDDVSIWNTSLNTAQIQAAMNHPLSGTEAGLIGYWRLDEGSGTTTADVSSHGNTGTLVNGPAWISSGAVEVAPDPGYALDLNGTNSYIQVPDGVWFTNDFTVEGWVYCRSYNNWSRLFDFGNAGYLQEVYLALSEGTTGFPKMGIFTNGNNNLVGSSQQLPLNQWTHLATTLSGSTATIFMNGNAVGSGTVLVPGNFVRTNNYIGRSLFGGDAYANAAFDGIRIWNVARSASQIQQKMNSPLTGSETNLIGYWRLDEGTGTNSVDGTGNGKYAVLAGTNSKPAWLLSRAPATNSAGLQLITLPATTVTTTSATLNGLVNPAGRAASGWFQWGSTTSYGSNTPIVALGNGFTNVSTNFVLTGLTPATPYHYRVAATNASGTNFGLDMSFTTSAGAPVVTTLSVSNITPNSATLAASVNPVGAQTTVYFLYGPTTSYGATNLAGSVGSGLSPVIIASTLSNLVSATTYHFLVVASNSVAVISGTDSTFQTPAGAPVVTTPLVSNLAANAATLSASVNPATNNAMRFYRLCRP